MAEQGLVKSRTKHTIFIERPGKPDLFGAISNAHHSTKTDGKFNLEDGDIVEFEESVDPKDVTRLTALNIRLIAKGKNMARKKTNNNQSQPKARVFVDLPTAGPSLIDKGDGKGEIHVSVGQIPSNPTHSIRTRLYVINGESRVHVKSIDVYLTQDVILSGLDLDFKESVMVETEMVGFGSSNEGKDRIQISAKPKEGAPKAAKAGSLTTKFITFANGTSPNLVQITHRDPNGNPAAGTVTVFLGQEGIVNNIPAVDGVCENIAISASGKEMVRIQLSDQDAVVSFMDQLGGTSTEYLKKGA